ncbi:MAG TPA: DUF1631 family protein, partial [Aquabacterium sp.]|nr:DUF1631 family protein [Aquabacterium sp.]
MTDPRLDSVLQAALNRLESAMNAAAMHSGTVLGQLALNSNNASQRQVLMDAELLLQRESSKLLKTFSKELQNRVEKEVLRPQQDSKGAFLSDTDWSSLSLVDDAEVERGVAADRLAQELAVECDKALEALNSYLSAAIDNGNPDKNPLRPQVIAKAWLKALGEMSDDLQVINLIVQHVGRLLSKQLAQAYEQTTQELKSLGIQPQSLSVQRAKSAAVSSSTGDHAPTRPASLQDG